jgi:hypothetical protein
MHAQRIDLSSLESVVALRPGPSRARARFAAYTGALRNDQIGPVGSNPFAQDGIRSATSIAGDNSAVAGALPKGQRKHVRSHPSVGRRRSITRDCRNGSATPTARGRGTILVRKTSWIYEAVRTRQMPCVRVGRYIRFTPQLLEKWLADNTEG